MTVYLLCISLELENTALRFTFTLMMSAGSLITALDYQPKKKYGHKLIFTACKNGWDSV